MTTSDRTWHWTFVDFIEEIISLSEITEVPGIEEQRSELIKEAWRRFPGECKALGLTDGLKEAA